jgi:hypothetical protein
MQAISKTKLPVEMIDLIAKKYPLLRDEISIRTSCHYFFDGQQFQKFWGAKKAMQDKFIGKMQNLLYEEATVAGNMKDWFLGNKLNAHVDRFRRNTQKFLEAIRGLYMMSPFCSIYGALQNNQVMKTVEVVLDKPLNEYPTAVANETQRYYAELHKNLEKLETILEQFKRNKGIAAILPFLNRVSGAAEHLAEAFTAEMRVEASIPYISFPPNCF